MKTLDDILAQWDIDTNIDSNHLDRASIETAKLHAKYLRCLSLTKIKKTQIEGQFNQLKKLRIKYYRGEMSREELHQYGWQQYQYNKPLKTEIDDILKGDEELQQVRTRLEYVEIMITTLESILNQLKQRDFQISNSIKWKQFISGH
jgi:hypothetical protein